MKIKFLQDWQGCKKGDIVDSRDNIEILRKLKKQGIIQFMQNIQSDKMMRNYLNK